MTRLSKGIKRKRKRTRNHRPTRKRKTRCYWHKDNQKYAKHVKNNACKRISIDWEMVRQVSSIIDVDRCSCRGSVKGKINKRLKRSRSIHQVSRSYRGDRNFLDRSTRCREAVEIVIRKSLRSSTNSKVSRKCWGGVELAFKSSFSRGEKHRHECNPTYNITNDPINILSSQKHLSTIIFKHMDLKNTHNKSTQFYISKTKLRQFSEHTLTHVNLVMAKSHCTCTCIKSSKEYCVLCVKNIARLHKCIHVMKIWDMRKSL